MHVCGGGRGAETWKVLPEWFAFYKLAWFQLAFSVYIQPWQNHHRKDHGSKIITIIFKTLCS
jgi:hypothetical protein